MGLKQLFTEHPATVGETYGEHMKTALSFSGPLLLGGLAALIHAIFPFLFTCTASDITKRLHARMSQRCSNCPSRHPGNR